MATFTDQTQGIVSFTDRIDSANSFTDRSDNSISFTDQSSGSTKVLYRNNNAYRSMVLLYRPGSQLNSGLKDSSTNFTDRAD
jgi:hypothetical protein